MGTEDESQSWYWADSDGVQSIVDEFELLSSLSTGTLPAYTLVWRVGWREWIPASRVAAESSGRKRSGSSQRRRRRCVGLTRRISGANSRSMRKSWNLTAVQPAREASAISFRQR